MEKKLFKLIITVMLLFSKLLLADEIYWGAEVLDKVTLKDFQKYVLTDITGYTGEYHFGESEGESTLKIIVTPAKKVYIQLYYAEYNEKKNKWDLKVDNYNNVEILGNKIIIKSRNLEFMTYSREHTRGILAESTENGKKIYEFGNYTGNLYTPGKYPEMSVREITKEETTKKTKKELRIMRNEVYARYGMIFEKGGEMEKYFLAQDWYSGNEKNTEQFLSQLEKNNVKLVIEEEKTR